MNQRLALKVLGQIMDWPEEKANEEFKWLRLMSRLKYDGYHDFLAGVRFVESLAAWLQQFKKEDREVAYEFVRKRLVYISQSEIKRLVENFYPEVVQRYLVQTVSKKFNIPEYRVWANGITKQEVERLKRKTLFMGMSDGARIDGLRRANVNNLSNEQILVATQLDNSKWKSLQKKLREALGDGEQFSAIYLIDDFIASGTTLIRKPDQKWEGKLCKFRETIDSVEKALKEDKALEDGWQLHVHHYLATDLAVSNVAAKYEKACVELNSDEWFEDVKFSYGHVMPASLPITCSSDGPFLELIKNYYDPGLHKEQKEHLEACGIEDLKLGYAKCALPIILEHNTPNNSVSLLWADTIGEKGCHPMHPLFRRRQRHN